MPQASDALRGQMHGWFGDPVSDVGPTKFLKSQGFTQNNDWTWNMPPNRKKLTEKEEACIVFLIDEWDEGGLAIGA